MGKTNGRITAKNKDFGQQGSGGVALELESLQNLSAKYEQIIFDAYFESPWEEPTGRPRRGRKKKTKSLNLIESLDKQRGHVLFFYE